MVWGCTLSWRLQTLPHSISGWRDEEISVWTPMGPQTGWTQSLTSLCSCKCKGWLVCLPLQQGPCRLRNSSSCDLWAHHPNILPLGIWLNHFSGCWQRRSYCLRRPAIPALSHEQFELLACCISELHFWKERTTSWVAGIQGRAM